MTREEMLAAIPPDLKRTVRVVRVPGSWFAVAGRDWWPCATKAEAEEWLRLRRAEDSLLREIFGE